MNFSLLLKIWVKNIGKNISKSLNSKYIQKLLDHAKKQFKTNAFETSSKGIIQKTAEATDVLIRNKTANKIIRVSKTSPENSSETNP